MTRASSLGSVAYEAESSWCEGVTTFANTLPHVGVPDVSNLSRVAQPSNRLVQYVNDGTAPIPGPMVRARRAR
jgi:hypothetical protein